jgi:hypothetical protein
MRRFNLNNNSECHKKYNECKKCNEKKKYENCNMCRRDNIGPINPQHIFGIQRIAGPQGIAGITGITGITGSIGITGVTGITGSIGITGATGSNVNPAFSGIWIRNTIIGNNGWIILNNDSNRC